MKDYLCIIVTDGEHEWQYWGVAVPHVGDDVTVRADPGGDVDFKGSVKEVHWELRTGSPGMIVTVWLNPVSAE